MSYKTRLYAFGSNGEAQLGLGYATDKQLRPALVPHSPSKIRKVCGGGNHTLIIDDFGTIWGTGSNQSWQFDHHEPYRDRNKENDALKTNDLDWPSGRLMRLCEFEKVGMLATGCVAGWETSIHLHDHAKDGVEVSGTDAHIYGAEDVILTATTGDEKRKPVSHTEMHPSFSPSVIDIAAGTHHYVAVLENGGVEAWGRWRKGQIGDVSVEGSHVLTMLRKVNEVNFRARRVVCGQHFTYIVGSPESGEHIVLGDDKHGVRSTMPENVKRWKDIGASWNAIFVLLDDGSLVAWGKENLWQLVPKGLPKLQRIAVGSDHILAITEHGQVIAWGWATHGNCGDLERLAQEGKVKAGHVTGTWNEIHLGDDGEEVEGIGAGCSTSFVWTKVREE